MVWKVIHHCSTILKQKFVNYQVHPRRGVKLSYKIIGDHVTDLEAPPILILHELLGSRKQWKSCGKIILSMTKRTVVTVDLRNHGKSPHVNSNKYEDIVEDVIKLLDKLKIKKASFIGHGVGGKAVMCLCLTSPKIVKDIIVVDVSPLTSTAHFKEYFSKVMSAMKKFNFSGLNKTKVARKEVKKYFKNIVDDDVTMKLLIANIVKKSDGTTGWRCNLDVLIKYFKEIASFPSHLQTAKYSGSTLFIGGQLSDYIPPDDLNGIRDMFPRAVVRYVSAASHYVAADDPKSFLELVIAFLKINSN